MGDAWYKDPSLNPSSDPKPLPATASLGTGSALYATCKQDTEEAQTSCDPKQNKMMMGVMSVATQILSQGAQNAIQAGSQVNQYTDPGVKAGIQANCERMGNMAQAATVATGSFKAYCTGAYSSCASSCADAEKAVLAAQQITPVGATPEDLKQVRSLKRDCEKMSDNIAGAANDLLKFAGTSKAMTQCLIATNPNLGGMNGNCEDNMFDPSCKTQVNERCDNPANAGSPVCICNTNPNASVCGSGSSSSFSSLGGSSGGGGSGGGAVDGSAFGGPGGSGSGPDGFPISDVASRSDNSASPTGGHSGSGGGGKGLISGGGGNNSGKPGAAGAAGSRLNAGVIGGYGYGSAGGGGVGNSHAAPGNPAYYAKGGAGGAANGAVDLRQFLPGGKLDPSRNLAGISGPDGITGPNSDIWQKVRLRYFSVKTSLLP